ncbi:MAG: hypothetical protein GX790_01755 [Syntrophomonadaceae bacterium]|nr:hypothetical protein [Syntrophomonadaceae bacterium]
MALLFSVMTPNLVLANEDRPKEDPKIVIARDHWMPVYNAGETVNLSIPVENMTNTSATNVRVTISPAGDTFPFEMDKMSFTKYAYSLSGRSVFSYKVTIPANTKPGVYPISVNVYYETDYGLTGSESATVYVKIENDYKQPELKLMGVDFEGERIPTGKSVLIKLKIQNDGDLDLKDIELKLNGFSTQGISLDNWPDTQYVKSMKGREIKLVEYRLFLDSKMESGTYPLNLNLKYKDEYDKEYTKDTKVYLPIDSKGEDDLTPRIIIDNYYIPTEYVEAGEAFPLTISFFNTSETTTVKNIKISLNSDGQVFTPVGSSNSFYVNEINPREVIERTIVLRPKVDAENQNHTISADIEFQDTKGNKYSEKEIISIPVNQKIKLTISNIEKPPQVFVGSPTGVSVDFYNTGRTLIRNLLITTEGNFDVQDGTFYVGNLEPGTDNYYDVTIISHETGTLEGKIVFQYEDGIGNTYLLEEPFTLEVMEQEMPPMFDHGMDMNPPVEPSFMAKWKLPIIIAGILLLIGLVTFIVIRRKKKKQEEVFLDE